MNWRSDLRQYAEMEWPPEPPESQSGRVIVVEQHITDTVVEGTLPDSVFQPPAGYQRVANVPYPAGADQLLPSLRAYWEAFRYWLLSWFQ